MGQKIKKNPGKNKNNADRQRFQGGFVRTNPPFDYSGFEIYPLRSRRIAISLFPCFAPKRVHFLPKSLNSPFLRTASTEFHA
ncbi:hypothetical protein C7H09_03970 [Marinobacter fuscus]|uniref:Uncharacterized protein n=1 Tax=Marinobacter fuscus TaxID=2109942 RepID=A0A2T1KQI9_9GAMM|nr:hypothetical protein C7H09_03970 [Marinobacter fuscus]